MIIAKGTIVINELIIEKGAQLHQLKLYQV
jgi:hypothetical protein